MKIHTTPSLTFAYKIAFWYSLKIKYFFTSLSSKINWWPLVLKLLPFYLDCKFYDRKVLSLWKFIFVSDFQRWTHSMDADCIQTISYCIMIYDIARKYVDILFCSGYRYQHLPVDSDDIFITVSRCCFIVIPTIILHSPVAKIMRNVVTKQVSMTGTSNFTPQYLWGVITCPCLAHTPQMTLKFVDEIALRCRATPKHNQCTQYLGSNVYIDGLVQDWCNSSAFAM